MIKMCGILFSYGELNTNADIFHKSLSSLRHRGPDALNSVEYDHVQIGHTRLSIMDLDSRSDQPMEFEELIITYNGEIFNYEELRSDLKKLGYTFNTNGDTEVVLKLYHYHRENCFSYLNGMWSLVIYNKKTDEFIVSRDRFGQKPLFYYMTDKNFVCASELQALAEIIPYKPNLAAIHSFISEGDFDVNYNTFFSELFEFPEACFAVFKQGRCKKLHRYWCYEKIFQSKTQSHGDFNLLLQDAVKLRMKSDVEYCLLLSGGIDSTIIASMMREATHKKIKSFTYKSLDKDDESDFARQISDKLNLEPYYATLPNSPERNDIQLHQIVKNLGRGHSSPAILSVDQLYKMVKGLDCKVAIDGQGADELLAGYKWYHVYLGFDLLKRGDFKGCLIIAKDALNVGFKEILLMTLRAWLPKFVRKLLTGLRLKSLIHLKAESDLIKPPLCLRSSLSNSKVGTLNRLLIRQHKVGLKNLLYYGDIVSMLNSVENRSPFMDHRVVESGFLLDLQDKVSGSRNKNVLRKTYHYKNFKQLLERKKVGFNTPISKEYKTHIIEKLSCSEIFSLGFIDQNRFRHNVKKGMFDDHKYDRILFRLYQVCIWQKIFLKNGIRK